jgi:hypothetical protein
MTYAQVSPMLPLKSKSRLNLITGCLLAIGIVGTFVYDMLTVGSMDFKGVNIPLHVTIYSLLELSAYALIVYIPAFILSIMSNIKNKGRNPFGITLMILSTLFLAIGMSGAMRTMGF